jgi:hypothetical protein
MNIETLPDVAALFVGTWTLQSFTEISSDGSCVEPMGRSPQGFLLYTKEGIVSAQLTGFEDRSKEVSSKETGRSGGNGNSENAVPYIGYCGTFRMNVELGEVVHIPIVAHDRSLVGRALHRNVARVGGSPSLVPTPGRSRRNLLESAERGQWRPVH